MVQNFYHVHIAREGSKHPRWTYETNLSKKQVLDSFVVPFTAKREIICNGVVFLPLEISVFKIYSTTNKVLETSEFQNFSVDSEINKNGKEVTRELLEEGKKFHIEKEISVHSNQIFIVHSHDSESKLELARMIEKDFGLEAIILHEQTNKGNTIIEKFGRVSEAIMKLIPGLSCDIPSLLTRAKTIEQDLRKVKAGQNNSAINLYR